MSLDLSSTAMQIDRMVEEVRARQSDHLLRLDNARAAVEAFDLDAYEEKRRKSSATLAWNAPVPLGNPAVGHAPPALPGDFCVVAVDGSHIDIDRHLPARCFLINIGVAALTYGSRPNAELYSHPRLYASDHELVIRDGGRSREQSIEGAVLGAKRAVEEIRALAEVVKGLPADVPTLALMDGTLLMIGLTAYENREFVLRELIEEGFAQALEDLRQLVASRPLAVASYISLPRSAEFVNGLRLRVCPYEVAECDANCGGLATGQRPCDKSVGGVRDREVFSEILEQGERSAVFAGEYRVVSNYYRGHEVNFFYVNAGAEIGRVEVPSWIADDEAMLGLAHSLIIDQCSKGPGYPTALMEAHEQAVVTAGDRRSFVELVENAMQDRQMPVYTSEKNRSKRLRWV